MLSRLLVLLILALGCSKPGTGEPFGAGGAGGDSSDFLVAPKVEVGVPGGEGGLDFFPLEDGAELRLQTFGQGGTHLLVGVRCTGFGSRAFVSATLRNLSTGVEVREPPPASPQLLYCTEAEVCELVPYLVHASGLTEEPEERDGLRVLLTASVESREGAKAEASREVVLSTADL
ncbi:MAG: hypothetical protein K0R38_6640 [Polyangiaceae bacterium]|nr:hypothetical protein [Polyangiaceae bacterium]